jgi:hypothetical protein
MPPKRKVDADDTATDVADTETVDLSKRLKDTHSMRTALVKGPMGSLTKAFADALEEATGLDIMLVKPNVETAMAYAIRPGAGIPLAARVTCLSPASRRGQHQARSTPHQAGCASSE